MCKNGINKNRLVTKLSQKRDVAVLIVGDSIGYGSSSTSPELAWFQLVKTRVEEKFSVSCKITNISVGGTDSLFGYCLFMSQHYFSEFDLVIICHGQNDRPECLSVNYEGLLTSIIKKNPGAEVITILESSQREYTHKINEIVKLSNYYNCATADVLNAFLCTDEEIDNLLADGTHPNDKGEEIYADEVFSAIQKALTDKKQPPVLKPYIYEETKKFDSFRFIPSSELEREENILKKTVNCKLLVFICTDGPDGGSYKIYVDDVIEYDLTLKHDFEWIWQQPHTVLCSKKTEHKIKIELENSNDVMRISGVCAIG